MCHFSFNIVSSGVVDDLSSLEPDSKDCLRSSEILDLLGSDLMACGAYNILQLHDWPHNSLFPIQPSPLSDLDTSTVDAQGSDYRRSKREKDGRSLGGSGLGVGGVEKATRRWSWTAKDRGFRPSA